MKTTFARLAAAAVVLSWPLASTATSGIRVEPDPHGGAYVITAVDGGASCRDATAEEALRLNRRPDVPLRVFGEHHAWLRGNGAGASGLNIILRGTTQLDAEPEAKAAFERAAAIWENRIGDPITVYVDVDFGSTRFGEEWPNPNVIASATSASFITEDGGYAEVRAALVDHAQGALEPALYQALPADGIVPTDLGDQQEIVAGAILLRALGFFDPISTPDEEDHQAKTPSIGFNSRFSYDFDPDDGITFGKTDFVAVVVHEIGHMLGFASRVGATELGASIASAPGIFDLFRFRPGTTLDAFGTAQRILKTGGEQRFFAGGAEYALSTGNPRGENGDNQQASHWKDDAQTSVHVGIMDPTVSVSSRFVLTKADLEAFAVVGYDIVSPDCEDLEPNDTRENATLLPLGTPCRGGAGRFDRSTLNVPSGGSAALLHDLFAVTLPGSAKLDVTLTFENPDANLDLFLVGFDGTAATALASSDTGTTTEHFQTETLGPGTYTVAVSGRNGTAMYTLTATAIGLLQPPAAPSALTATGTSPSVIRLAWQDNSSDEDEFRIERRNANGSFTDIGSVAAGATAFDAGGFTAGGTATFRVRARNAAGNSGYTGEATATTPGEIGPCVADATTVCLLDGRFRLRIDYVNPFSNPPNQPGTLLAGRLLESAQNPDTGLFGFSAPTAVEVVVRIQDTRPFAQRFDIYYGGMTDVAYTVTVTDTETGVARQYHNAAGKVGGGVDRVSFPTTGQSVAAFERFDTNELDSWNEAKTMIAETLATAPCVADPTTVCLLNDRFQVKIDYVNPFSTPPNQPGTFLAGRLLEGAQNPDTGLFGFNAATAVEVIVRIQDTRPFAQRFDVYYGGMTDVGYTVTVTDTVTGTVRQYQNQTGKVGGGVDRASFPAD
ncbi:MAG: NF038122 family metalloprotease [Thermoanaerobaculia bacterium]